MTSIRILIVDDLPLFCEGLQLTLAQDPAFEVVGTAPSGEACLRWLDEEEADLVFMDIEMPGMNGIETTRILRERHPGVKVLALTMTGETDRLVDMMEAGASGYLLKDCRKEELVAAAKGVASGGLFFSSTTTPQVARLLTRSAQPQPSTSVAGLFSEVELQIIRMICEEYPTKQIGPALGISPFTVNRHRSEILQKTGAQTAAGVVLYALRHGLVKV